MENQNRTFMIPEGQKKTIKPRKNRYMPKLNKQIEWLLILFHNCGRYKRKR